MNTPFAPAAVLWDLDGTLVDSEIYWANAELELAKDYSGAWSHEDGLALTGLSLPVSAQIMRQKMQIDDLSIDEVIAFLTNSVLRNLLNEVPWRPGALELLKNLALQQVPQALVTMSMRSMATAVVQKAEQHLGMPIFSHLVAGDDVTNGKPHPEAYLKAAELLNVDIAKCLAIEDSVNGMTSALNAGARVLVVPNVVPVAQTPGITIWDTLENSQLSDLASLFTLTTQQRLAHHD